MFYIQNIKIYKLISFLLYNKLNNLKFILFSNIICQDYTIFKDPLADPINAIFYSSLRFMHVNDNSSEQSLSDLVM